LLNKLPQPIQQILSLLKGDEKNHNEENL